MQAFSLVTCSGRDQGQPQAGTCPLQAGPPHAEAHDSVREKGFGPLFKTSAEVSGMIYICSQKHHSWFLLSQ